MEVVAHILDWKVTRTELDFEENRIRDLHPQATSSEIRNYAVSELIDRYLLMQEAINHGITVDEEELEEALMLLIEEMDSPNASVLVNRKGRGEQIERVLKSNLYIQKYLATRSEFKLTIPDEVLYKFYEDRNDFFCQNEEVRVSHILVKGNDEATRLRIQQIRNSIQSPEDFCVVCQGGSECSSSVHYGDLGYFPQGRMVKEMEKVAFSLQINEISQPFLTRYGYHILMVTDRAYKQVVPFETIRESLKQSLIEIEEEVAKARILTQLREKHKNDIKILDKAFQ